jgi:type III restriction enzyme
MAKVGIEGSLLTEENANRIYKSFQTLFRARGSTVVLERTVQEPKLINTRQLEKETISVGSIKYGSTVFYSDIFESECSQSQGEILRDLIEDQSLPRSASKEVNHYLFKTPVNVVLTKQEPERKFVELLTSSRFSEKIDSWIKSRDMNFYSIEYSWRKGEHSVQANFNPDFFIKIGSNICVVEIKSDDDDSDENIAKYKWAKKHFSNLNEELAKSRITDKYFFHFLSPANYSEFFEYLIDGRLFQNMFRSSLEDKLDMQS